MRRHATVFLLALLCCAGCDDDERPPPIDGPGPGGGFGSGGGAGGGGGGDAGPGGPCEGPPGLWEPGSCSVLAEGVQAFQPTYVLWSDGLSKERFIFLPPGSTIDTSDADGWVFPAGTRIYKTFSSGSKRLETRLLEKLDAGEGVSSWDLRSFAWNDAQDAVEEVPEGRRDVLGTEHDIPSTQQCIDCHAPVMRDVALGVSAIQLNHAMGGMTLTSLNAEGRLSVPVSTELATAPGNNVEAAALGYLHANCGNCHGGDLAPAGLRMNLFVGDTEVETTQTFITAVAVPSQWVGAGITARIEPGVPESSAVPARMRARGDIDQMPPIGSEVVDTSGVAIVEAFIEAL